MNPTLDISVNRKSRAAAAATGMVTVGALVDVRVGGLDEIEIPDWGEGDGWKGKSLRLRVVDPFGHDVVRFPLADGDAWVQDGDGYSATVDFGTDRMRAAFRGIPFDEAMTFGLILDSSVDRAQYAVGSVTVGNWTPATYEDPTILPDWRETLADLNGRLDATEAARASAEASASAAAADAESAAANAEATAGDVAETEKNLAAVVSVKEVVATTMQDIAGLTADAEQYAGDAAASAKSAIAALGDASSCASAAAAYANEAKYNAAEAASAATAAASEAAKSAVEDAMGKVLDGETLKTNTTNAMRNAIRAIGKALGASVACLAMACGAATVSRQSLNEMDLDKDPQVVTNVTFEGLATVEDLKGVVPADYAAVSNAAMGAAAYADDRAAAVSNDLAEAISSHADDKSNPHGVTASQVGAMPASEGAEIWAFAKGVSNNVENIKIVDGAASVGGTKASAITGTMTGYVRKEDNDGLGMYSNPTNDEARVFIVAGAYTNGKDKNGGLCGTPVVRSLFVDDMQFNMESKESRLLADGSDFLTQNVADGRYAAKGAISASNATFSNAVLAVGLNVDTNAVAAINELLTDGASLPTGGVATVGGLLAALAAGLAALKKKTATIETKVDAANAALEEVA